MARRSPAGRLGSERFDANGEITDEATRENIRTLLDLFVNYVRWHTAGKPSSPADKSSRKGGAALTPHRKGKEVSGWFREPFPLAGGQLDQFAAQWLELRGPVVTLDLVRAVRDSVDEAIARGIAVLDQVTEHAGAFYFVEGVAVG